MVTRCVMTSTRRRLAHEYPDQPELRFATLKAAVLAALDGRLAKFKQPKRVIVVPDLPRNAMGKVQKNALREQYADLYR
mgnify:CR=1 FL=1